MNNSVVGFMIRQNSYQGFPSRSCGLLFQFRVRLAARTRFRGLYLLALLLPLMPTRRTKSAEFTLTDTKSLPTNKAARSATMWLCRLRLHPSNAQQAGYCVSVGVIKI